MIDLQLVEYIAYAVVGLLLLAGIVLGVVNWTHLFSLSSQITMLENEIEKKTFEFANLKKSRQAAAAAAQAAAAAMPVKEDSAAADSDEIHVVRNVRAGVEEEKESFLQDQVVQMGHTPAPEAPLPIPPPPPTQQLQPPQVLPAQVMPARQMPEVQQAPQERYAPPPLGPVAQGDVMEVIEGTDPGLSFTDENSTVSIPLYSMAKKDADFEQAFSLFSSTVPLNAGTPVAVDFSQIMFLYERELSILEQMNTLARQYGSPLSFINCDAELKTTLRSRKGLSGLVSA
jgi:hypothetical protein